MADIRVFGGPTALIEFGGLRFLTDPTFDQPGHYPVGGNRVLTKTAPTAITPAELGPVDAVLLSHDEHPDNLDTSGRAFLATAPLVLVTRGGAGGWAAPHAASRPGSRWSCPARTAARSPSPPCPRSTGRTAASR